MISGVDSRNTAIVIVFSILAIGVVAVATSSFALSEKQHGTPFAYALRHQAMILAGIMAGAFAAILPTTAIKKASVFVLLVSIVLMLLIHVSGYGVSVNGASRWLQLPGFRFQPYELAKLSLLLFAAFAVERYLHNRDARGIYLCLLMLLVVMALLLLQPDFGSLVIGLSVAGMVLFVVSGINRITLISSLILAGFLVYMIISEPYRLERVVSIMDPWSDRYGSGFQLVQALIAEGSGGVFGLGLGGSVQKMLYLPEAHTDFSLSILGEELGLTGILVVIGLYLMVYILLSQQTARLYREGEYYGFMLLLMVSASVFMQALVSIGVNYGLFPTKGITLPFVSYGGTSVVVFILMVALIVPFMSAGRRGGGAVQISPRSSMWVTQMRQVQPR